MRGFWATAIAMCLSAAACSGSDELTEDFDAGASVMDAGGGLPDASGGLPDASSGSPDAAPDAGGGPADAAGEPDAMGEPDATASGAAFGEACTVDGDCMSGVCRNFGMLGLVCTVLCDEASDCPSGSMGQRCNMNGFCRP